MSSAQVSWRPCRQGPGCNGSVAVAAGAAVESVRERGAAPAAPGGIVDGMAAGGGGSGTIRGLHLEAGAGTPEYLTK